MALAHGYHAKAVIRIALGVLQHQSHYLVHFFWGRAVLSRSSDPVHHIQPQRGLPRGTREGGEIAVVNLGVGECNQPLVPAAVMPSQARPVRDGALSAFQN